MYDVISSRINSHHTQFVVELFSFLYIYIYVVNGICNLNFVHISVYTSVFLSFNDVLEALFFCQSFNCSIIFTSAFRFVYFSLSNFIIIITTFKIVIVIVVVVVNVCLHDPVQNDVLIVFSFYLIYMLKMAFFWLHLSFRMESFSFGVCWTFFFVFTGKINRSGHVKDPKKD